MSIASRITSIEGHIGDIYDSVELTGVDTTDIDKNLVNVPNTLKEGYIDIINNGTDTLYNNFPKVNSEGTSLTLNNTYQAPMRNNLKGNTSQTGTPTPTSPIPVNVVSGDNTITISNQGGTDSNTYNIDLPVENLFDKENVNILNANISSNGTISSNNNTRTIYIPIQPSTTYTISKILSSQFRASVYDSIPQINSVGTNTIANFSGTTITITSTSNSKYLAVFCYINSDTQTLQQILDSLQVEIGSKANSYTPYGTTPIELCKIGNYQDYFYKDSDKWYLHKEIGKYIYNNVGSVNTSKTNYYNISGLTNQGWINTADTNTYLSTEYPSVSVQASDGSFQSITANMDYAFGLHLNGTTIRFKDNRGLSASDFKNDLVGTEIYFALATPTDNEVTYQPLIDQLNELEKAISYENQTNISQVNNDLPFIISASALKKG